jgi:hypothetical protein
MKQINCTVLGNATLPPVLIVDTFPTEYVGQFESPSRVIFTLADSVPPWGATIHFAGKTVRVVVPVAGAAEGPVLDYGPAVPSIRIEGQRFVTADGGTWVWGMMTGFCDYARFLRGEDISPALAEARDLGANGRRVFGMMWNITRFIPQEHPRY